MDTLIVLRDSVAFVGEKASIVCQPCIKEVGTTWLDVGIVGFICAAIAVIVCYGSYRYFKWKDDVRDSEIASAKEKCNQDKENRKEKQIADLQNELLSFLKERTYKTDKSLKEGTAKDYDEAACKKYEEMLQKLIDDK